MNRLFLYSVFSGCNIRRIWYTENRKSPAGGHGFIYKPSGQLHWLNKLKREKEERDDGLEMYAADYRIGTG